LKSKHAARADEAHPPRGLPGFQATSPDEQFGAFGFWGKSLEKQTKKTGWNWRTFWENQRSNIPSYLLESLYAPDALNGLANKRRG